MLAFLANNHKVFLVPKLLAVKMLLATKSIGAYPWGLAPGYTLPYETTSELTTTSVETYPQQGYNSLYDATTTPTTSNFGPYP